MQPLLTARFGAVLLDNWMPKINGIELRRLIRSLDKNFRFSSAPAQSQREIKKATFWRRAQGYFGKPFDPEKLTTTLRAAVNSQPT